MRMSKTDECMTPFENYPPVRPKHVANCSFGTICASCGIVSFLRQWNKEENFQLAFGRLVSPEQTHTKEKSSEPVFGHLSFVPVFRVFVPQLRRKTENKGEAMWAAQIERLFAGLALLVAPWPHTNEDCLTLTQNNYMKLPVPVCAIVGHWYYIPVDGWGEDVLKVGLEVGLYGGRWR